MTAFAFVRNLVVAYLVVILLYNTITAIAGLLVGAKIKEFGVFVGPSLFKFKIGETIFRFSLLPLGGFVKFGEGFEKLFWYQRLFVLIAGLLSYCITAFLVFGLNESWQKYVNGFGQILWGAVFPASEGFRLVKLLFEFVQNNSFLTLIGLVSTKIGAFNSYPIGLTNGSFILKMLFEGLGLKNEKFIERLLLFGVLLILLLMLGWAVAFFSFLNS